MDLRRLITLKTVIEEGSFVKASRKLCCTQSTITFHIQQLEQELSLQLFEKIGRRMCLTKAGQNIMPHVHEMIRVMAGLRQAAQQDAEPNGELRVAIGETLLAYKMPAVLERFKRLAPGVRLSLQSLNCYVIRDALLADEADLGIFYRVGNDAALQMESFGEQPLVLVASPALSGIDFTRPDQHLPVSFIINEPQCIFRQLFESTLRQRAITLDGTIELWSIESIKRCVASNLGVSFLPRFAVERELSSGELQELPFSPTPLGITALCAHHAGKFVSPAMRVFMECVQACLTEEGQPAANGATHGNQDARRLTAS
ncbi:LysR family transcriptional regulator [Aeromonas lusitana]|uniref:LysR family transcriptional regulator n=1 Tax=Aeromonas lusitana TaxID=931529 RepID=A0A2M8H508_9GAMM|nr:LysR family transcriptional regulator [Aeromonas lusitana]PJC91645.1 LysR family transcriptional regulator [Aeromonas lusitana]